MKVGILTFHCAHNYGAVLQAYALQTFLQQQGCDARIIDYKPDFLLTYKSLYNFKGFSKRSFLGKLKHLLGAPLIYRKRRQRYEAFDGFIQEKFNLVSVGDSDFDLLIVGSDQVWNLELTEGSNEFYGGYTPLINSKRKITYAASIGNASFSDTNIAIWKKYISSFDNISFREKESISYFNKICERNIEHTMDPVFLLEIDDWNKISYPIHEKYVLVYQVHFEPKVLEIAHQIAREKNCKVIQLVPRVMLSSTRDLNDCAGIEEFISLFQNAEFVVTTSFHGTAFSILNNKDFYTVKLGSRVDERSVNLLKSLGLEKRAINKNDSFNLDSICYQSVNIKLKELKTHSQQYLQNNVKK